jgi:hypothetical protein
MERFTPDYSCFSRVVWTLTDTDHGAAFLPLSKSALLATSLLV